MDNPLLLVVLALLVPWAYAVSLLIAQIGGWRHLAKRFPANDEPSGKRFFMQTGSVGQIGYGSCLTIHCSPNGLRISVLWPFRLAHPPLFIPWDVIQNCRAERLLWMDTVVFDVQTSKAVKLRLPKKVFADHTST
jgi:hypothetical protein